MPSKRETVESVGLPVYSDAPDGDRPNHNLLYGQRIQAMLDELAARLDNGEITRSEADGIAGQILSDIE